VSYRQSKARVECEDRLKALRNVARGAASKKIPIDVRQAALGFVVVQLHSAMEEYFNRIIEDWVGAFRCEGMRTKNLPSRARTWLAHAPHFDVYRRYVANENEYEFLDKACVAKYNIAYFDEKSEIPSTFAATALIGSRTYPSKSNIKTVLARIGIDNLRPYLSKKLRFDFDLFMESVSATRSSVTHKYSPDTPLEDVIAFSNKIQKLVMWLDHLLCVESNKNCGPQVWAQVAD